MRTRLDEMIQTLALSPEKAAGVLQLRKDESYGDADRPWKNDCFLTSWLKDELAAAGLFDQAVIASLGEDIGKRMPFLKDMIAGEGEYRRFLQKASPFLFFVGDDICYGALEDFIYGFGEAFEKAGYMVVYQERSEIPTDYTQRFIGTSYRGIFGMQDPLLSYRLADGEYFLKEVNAPLYLFSFDHPAGFYSMIRNTPADTTILTLDRYYAEYVEKYLHRKAWFFPPAGRKPEGGSVTFQEFRARKLEDYTRRDLMDISFLGTPKETLSQQLEIFENKDYELYSVANTYAQRLYSEVDKPSHQAFLEAAEDTHLLDKISDEDEFAYFFSEWVPFEKSVSQTYRQMVVKTLVSYGMDVHLYSNGWYVPGAHAHAAIPYEQIRAVYRRSRISLNVMSWHKAGFTERIAEPQLQGSLVVTDSTEYLKESYTDGEDIVMFDLTENEIARLPERLSALLSDRERLIEMSWRGYQKALKYHTWDARVDEFLRRTV